MLYQAKITEAGAKRLVVAAGTIVEYETIHPLGEAIQVLQEGGQVSHMGFVGTDRTVDLISWPAGFNYGNFPDPLIVNVTDVDLRNGGHRGQGPDGIWLALKRDYPSYEPIISNPNRPGGVRLLRNGLAAHYPPTSEYITLIDEIDLTDGRPLPTRFEMNLATVSPQPFESGFPFAVVCQKGDEHFVSYHVSKTQAVEEAKKLYNVDDPLTGVLLMGVPVILEDHSSLQLVNRANEAARSSDLVK